MHQITLTIGTGFRADGMPLHATEAARATAALDAVMAARFGGFTRHTTVGGWRDQQGHIVQEPGLCYEIVAEVYDAEVQTAVREVAESARKGFQQSSVLLRVSQVDAEFLEG